MKRYLTAIARRSISRPAALALREGLIQSGDRLLDYGCGRGTDVKFLLERGVEAVGFDPHYFPGTDCSGAWDVVMINYVLNVIEDVEERKQALKRAWSLCRGILVVAVRTDREKVRGEVYKDGVKTSRGTFQKLFSQQEVESFVRGTLHKEPCWVARGVFFLIK